MTSVRPLTIAALLAFAFALLLACSSDEPSAVSSSATSVATPALDPAGTAEAGGPAATSTPQPIVIAAVGDLMLARDITTLMETNGAIYPFERVMPLFEGADLVIGNLEGTFTNRGEAAEKTYTFRTPPALATGVALAGFDAVSLANNHSFDYGAIGLTDTTAALEGVGVTPFGAGADEQAAYSPVLFEVGGRTVALLGFDLIGETQAALGDSPGVAWGDERALAAVAAAAERADHVVVMLHAGVEYSHEPTEEQINLAHGLIDAGADVVVGHHPHALQPPETYRGGLILYSLGNFVFDLDADDLAALGTAPFESAVAVITLAPDIAPQVEFRAAYIDVVENRPRPAEPEERSAVLDRVAEMRR